MKKWLRNNSKSKKVSRQYIKKECIIKGPFMIIIYHGKKEFSTKLMKREQINRCKLRSKNKKEWKVK